MNRKNLMVLFGGGLVLAFASQALAQSVDHPVAPALTTSRAPNPTDQTVKLTPFEVQGDSDDSYGALNSNSITGFRTELKSLPVSADVFNETFMRDIGATTVEDMVKAFAPGAGFSFNDPSTTNNQPGDRNPDSYVALRGLAAPAQRMDGFLPLTGYNTASTTSTGYSDNFNFERVEVINGPQALLYGFGGGGGVVNMVSKQARFDRRSFGGVRFELNQWGGKKAVFDYGWGGQRVAMRMAIVDQQIVTSRVNIGGPMKGAHLQLAVKLGEHSVVRLTGMHSYTNRPYSQSLTFTAISAANDSRNGQNLKYLLASNQLAASTSGASGAGDIGSKFINWGNVDSQAGGLTGERTVDNIALMTVETKIAPWLSGQLSLGIKDWKEDAAAQVGSLFASNSPNNPLGVPAVSVSLVNDNYTPTRTKAIRYAFLAQNQLFGGRARSSTIIGTDFSRVKSAFISYRYYQADSNWATIKDAAGNRIAQGRVIWPLAATPQTYLPAQHTNRVTFSGVNYNREMANPVDPKLISPDNPLGVRPGGEGNWQVKDINKGVFGANTTEWMGGRLQTLAGFRLADFYKISQNQGTAPTALNPSIFATRLKRGTSFDYNVGANYALREWLRPYFAISSSYSPPITQQAAPYGDDLKPAHSRGAEIGVKFQDSKDRISGSMTGYYVVAANEGQVIQSALSTAINPPGINGRLGVPSTWINVDRQTKGLQIALNANPSRNWRMRVSGAWTEGTVSSGTAYPLLYNDQFYANSQGQVTYRDGSVVYVPPVASATTPAVTATSPGAVPLTIAMMNTPGVYYANPVATSGAILGTSAVARVLAVADPVHGPIRTGAVGLPISQLQINPGFTPPSSIEVARAGDLTTGYPTYSITYTSVYSIPSGMLKGLRFGGTARAGWDLRRYYYYVSTVGPGAPRNLFRSSTMAQFDGIFGYSRKVGRYLFSSQVNVSNVFNRYDVLITPNAANGFGGVKGALFTQQPRSYLWTNSISF